MIAFDHVSQVFILQVTDQFWVDNGVALPLAILLGFLLLLSWLIDASIEKDHIVPLSLRVVADGCSFWDLGTTNNSILIIYVATDILVIGLFFNSDLLGMVVIFSLIVCTFRRCLKHQLLSSIFSDSIEVLWDEFLEFFISIFIGEPLFALNGRSIVNFLHRLRIVKTQLISFLE